MVAVAPRVSDTPASVQQANKPWLAYFTTALPLASVAAAWHLPAGWNFIGVALALTAFLAALGVTITGSPLGVLINERNLMSLSRLQAATWTVIVLSGYLTLAILRVRDGISPPLDIAIPQELWWAMGISTTSLLGTPLLLTNKRSKTPDSRVVDNTAAQLAESPEDIQSQSQGALYANKDIHDARLADMFQGDEVGNTAQLDLAKVQMFYFTVIAAVSYFVSLATLLQKPGSVSSLPALSQGFIALLAISHGGYLVSKTTDHSNSKPA
ncbi:hypothetical protein MFU01_18740 [Myxococcus fulvus]|uniref:Uncharacterized protein n=1 Tax=Myxococcus fulvus TaxID=33 RepID=A0A511SZ12_MYXFU|nr:hypothetical protein MFU01_18740 [Myxococcus fulvus]